MTNLDRKPKQDEIAAWIRATFPDVPELRAEAFAGFFEGMAWKHLRPLTQIAVNSHIDTADKLAAIVTTAADMSGDRSFRMGREEALRTAAGVGVTTTRCPCRWLSRTRH